MTTGYVVSALSSQQLARAHAARFSPPRGLRRVLCLCAAMLCASLVATTAMATNITDLRGQTVTVQTPVKSIAIDDGRFLIALALLHDDPASVLAAWPHDIHRIGRSVYDALLAHSPALAAVPKIASSAGSFNLEALLAVDPGAAVFSLGRGPTPAQISLMQRVGIPVVFIDFFMHPLENQARSLRILGQLTGATDRAEAYIKFRQQHLQHIAQRVATIPQADWPTVFIEAHAGISADCCFAPGNGNIGEYIKFVGGHNIGADVIQGASGKLSLEYVISRNPDIYIATGGPSLKDSGGLVLGPGVDAETASKTLARVAARPGIAELSAIGSGRVYGISHLLLNSPLDIVAIERLAKWIHPELFADLDPQQTLDTIEQRFLAVPYAGTHWTSLE